MLIALDNLKRVIPLTFLILFLFSCKTIEPGIVKYYRDQPIYREVLTHTKLQNKKIELFWTKPSGAGPWPTLIFIHGHQHPIRDGGAAFIMNLGRLSRAWKAVMGAVSQPGYGNSDGPPDFCGPFSQNAVLEAINFFRNKQFVKPEKIVLYGISRGAIVASMVATKDHNLAGVILISGIYNFDKAYPTGISGLDRNIEIEAGISKKSFLDRSAFYHADKIKPPLLIIHGAEDGRFSPDQVELFSKEVQRHGVDVQYIILPGIGHYVPVHKRYPYVKLFLKKVFH